MTITQEQRTYARLAGIMFLANYVVQGLGDSVTILARRGETSPKPRAGRSSRGCSTEFHCWRSRPRES